ncbi:MAG: helix-turn-helix domain-containing protein [Planctomycetes bacterium]|nr:helix-turn-helix domain-containing protein [Planctomycetota bacterium]
MSAQSMDLRLRVLADCDAGLPTKQVAQKYSVSRTWVRWLKQRRRETGSIEPGRPTGRPRKIDRDQLTALVSNSPTRPWSSCVTSWASSVRRRRSGWRCTPCGSPSKTKRCGPPSRIARMLPKDARNGGRGKSDSIRSGSFSSMKRGRTRR